MKNFINNSISFNGNETKKVCLMLKSYLNCVNHMNKNILHDVYCLRSIKNAVTECDFGSWNTGVCDATQDDHFYSFESGFVKNTFQT